MSLLNMFLRRFGVGEGDYVEIMYDGSKKLRGVIMPRNMFSQEDILVIKLDNGYNVGLKMDRINDIRPAKPDWPETPRIESKGVGKRGLPKIKILAVGGTILSRVDYRTGGVRSAVEPEELIEIIPEVVDVADIDVDIIMNKYSEHLTPSDWTRISEEVYKAYRDGYDGIVVLHGTDTMAYTSAALSYSLNRIDKPVILVGSQRSSDRPSSDAALNLLAALYAAGNLRYGGVYVAMHHTTSDKEVAIHIGTRVRKNHTSARYAFESIGLPPLALVKPSWSIEYTWVENHLGLVARGSGNPEFRPLFSDRAVLIKFYPGMKASHLRLIILDPSVEAVVIEGTGLGHVSSQVAEVIQDAISMGKHVFMTSQCIWGRVNLNVYDTGRMLLKYGVIPLEDMLPETAYVKASWVIGNYGSDALKELMPTPMANDILPRSFPASRRCSHG